MARSARMPRKKVSTYRSDLDEALQVFARAEKIYSGLLGKRQQLQRELSDVEAALSKLGHIAGAKEARPAKAAPGRPKAAPVAKAAPAAKAASKAATPKRRPGRPPGGSGKPTLSQLLVSAMGKSSRPMTAKELLSAVSAQRPGAVAGSLQIALRDLRDKGVVKATGKAKRFSYSLARPA